MSDQLATVEREERDGELVVRLRGEMDLSNVERLRERIEREAEGAVRVAIELGEIEYIDSQGLRLLKQLSTRLGERGCALELVAPPHSVARSVLDLTGMSEDIPVRDALSS